MATLAVTGRADLSDAQWRCSSAPAARQEAGAPAGTDETAAHRRDPVADPDRRAVAGRAAGLRPWQTVYGLFRRWQRNGTWRAILAALQGRADAAGLITWDVSVDSTVARAHRPGPDPAGRSAGRAARRRAGRAGRRGCPGQFPRRADDQGAPGVWSRARSRCRS